MNDHRFACLFSAFPYARSVHTIQLSSSENLDVPWTFSAFELSWIAYAIFHPESKRSSWTKLLFCGCELAQEAKNVLASMVAASNTQLRQGSEEVMGAANRVEESYHFFYQHPSSSH